MRSGYSAAPSQHAEPAKAMADMVRPTSLAYYLRMQPDNREAARSQLPAEQVDLAVEVFRMLADATRVQLLWALVDHELSVNDLADQVGKAATSVSQHLAKLRMARLVRTRREGTQVFYRLENDHIAQLVRDAIYNAEHAGSGVPGHHRGDGYVPVDRRSAGGRTT
jgi:DNA-binding transcriptional ArsR family regulator